ncbi:hypothetical protein ABIA23_003433 [Sinorhizobium fredii]
MRKENMVLKDILSALVRGYGSEQVHRALTEVSRRSPGDGQSNFDGMPSKPKKAERSSAKLTATDIAARSDAPAETKQLLLSLASRFDRKAFLPTIGDVRNFLEMRGIPSRNLKQRPDAFRQVLRIVSSMPPEALEKLIRESRHYGPSELGPLSDAIRSTSERIRSLEPPSDTPRPKDSDEPKSNASSDQD